MLHDSTLTANDIDRQYADDNVLALTELGYKHIDNMGLGTVIGDDAETNTCVVIRYRTECVWVYGEEIIAMHKWLGACVERIKEMRITREGEKQ